MARKTKTVRRDANKSIALIAEALKNPSSHRKTLSHIMIQAKIDADKSIALIADAINGPSTYRKIAILNLLND